MTAIIECHGLSKSYGDKRALSSVDFQLYAGAPIALVGPNGAGKSTLFSILAGYIKASSGHANILGKPAASHELIGRIGVLPQDALLDPKLTILNQLSYFARLQGFSKASSMIEAQRVLELMQLKHIGSEKVTALSHGMKKRVAIAQALIGSPELVLLDEPTAGLDPENARNIRQQVTALASETTFIISSHNLVELERMCSQVLHLEQGVLKTQQAIGSSANTELNFLTLRLQQGLSEENGQTLSLLELKQKVSQLKGVKQVDNKQNDEFIIRYDGFENSIFDQDLLKLLAHIDLPYRQITHGQSLEDQLFMAKQ
jgi:ABC-2 type transport system ATP-binding protein